MKIRETIFSNLDLNKCYLGHEQYSKGFSRRSDTLRTANAGSIVTFKPYNSKSTVFHFMKKYFIIVL